MYRQQLAVLLHDGLRVYRQRSISRAVGEEEGVATQAKTDGAVESEGFDLLCSLEGSLSFSHILLTATAVVLCKGKTLEIRDLAGEARPSSCAREVLGLHRDTPEKQSVMDFAEECAPGFLSLSASVRYLRVARCKREWETLLAGLRDGSVVYVHLKRRPLEAAGKGRKGVSRGLAFELSSERLVQHSQAVTCVEVSRDGTQLALVDSRQTLFVFALQRAAGRGGEVKAVEKFRFHRCSAVAFNSKIPDCLAHSDGRLVTVQGSENPSARCCCTL